VEGGPDYAAEVHEKLANMQNTWNPTQKLGMGAMEAMGRQLPA
jgi:hypothetical protein